MRPQTHHPSTPAPSITANWPTTPGCTKVMAQAASINAARPAVAHSPRAIPHTAWATTATATTLRPCTSPAGMPSPPAENPRPNNASAKADGSVKPTQAASAPPQPLRISPSAIPTWLLAGPGKNWHSATRSA